MAVIGAFDRLYTSRILSGKGFIRSITISLILWIGFWCLKMLVAPRERVDFMDFVPIAPRSVVTIALSTFCSSLHFKRLHLIVGC